MNGFWNSVLVSGEKSKLEAIAAAFKKTEPFQSLLPCPEFLMNTKGNWFEPASPEMLENERISGFRSYFDWRIWNWGTPREIGPAEVKLDWLEGSRLRIGFETAGGPATHMIEWLSAEYSACTFELACSHEGTNYQEVDRMLIRGMRIWKVWHTRPNLLQRLFYWLGSRTWHLRMLLGLIKPP